MTYLSIIEKFKILFNTLLDFEFILIFTILLLLFSFLYIIKKLNGKRYALFVALSFLLVFGISIISNYKVLSNTFDNFSTIIFQNIYFPSIYVYIGVLIISFISFLVSIFNIRLKKIYKVINSAMFIVNNVFFVIILNIIAKNKIDIFSVNSLYTNTSLLVILELSMGLFILWILSLVTVYVTNCISDRLAYRKDYKTKELEQVTFNPILEVNNEIANSIISSDEVDSSVVLAGSDANIIEGHTDNISDSMQNINNNLMVDVDVEASSEIVLENNDINENCITVSQVFDVTFNDILNGNISVTYYDNNVTKEEYNLADPQQFYEDKYNEVKKEEVMINNDFISLNDDIKDMVELSIEEKTLIEKEKVSEERLLVNTISLNDLIVQEDDIKICEIENNDNVLNVESDNENKNTYTIDDYKLIIKMLNSLKVYSDKANINIDDAVAISLISNYSIDDCMKFKSILENNLN